MNTKDEKLIFFVIFKYEALNGEMKQKAEGSNDDDKEVRRKARSRNFRANFSNLNDIWRSGTPSSVLPQLDS